MLCKSRATLLYGEIMNTWQKLSSVNVNEHVKTKGTQKYLSWAWAWGVTKEIYPSMTYSVKDFDGKPYCFDEHLGYMVQTEVTIEGESLPMHLFVMDGANKAQKNVDYQYATKYGDKTCLAATMFDVNTTIMRCLVKNLAMFGLGHYIYAGEDLPRESEEQIAERKIVKKREIIPNTKGWENAKAAFIRDGNFEKVFPHARISLENQALIVKECSHAQAA